MNRIGRIGSACLIAAQVPSPIPDAPLSRSSLSALTASEVSGVEARLEAALVELIDERTPGASFAVVLPDGTLVRAAAGSASVDTGEALTPRHRFLVGSTGKTFVAAALLHLVARGELSLDAPAADVFDSVPPWLEHVPNGGRVTLRQLLRHQSGIPRYVFDPRFTREMATDPDRVWKPEELLGFLRDTEPLFAPGEGWAYSDSNYLVLGLVIERVAGRSFYALAEELFIEPLGLRDTLPSDRRDLPGLAQGHVFAGRAMGVPARALGEGGFTYNVQFEGCGGGWISTPSDLARWARSFWSGDAFDGDDLALLRDGVRAEALGPGVRYGAGTMLRPTDLGESLGHDGFMPGYLTTLAWYPQQGVAAALQLNGDDARALRRPLEVLLTRLVAEALASPAGAK